MIYAKIYFYLDFTLIRSNIFVVLALYGEVSFTFCKNTYQQYIRLLKILFER